MSEIEIYDPEGKCSLCFGSGHVTKTVCMPNSNNWYVLFLHCPLCNGTGVKPAIEKMMEENALREQGLIA